MIGSTPPGIDVNATVRVRVSAIPVFHTSTTCTKPDFGVPMGVGPRRHAAASAVGLPQGPVGMLMLIVARGCVERCLCRFTLFAASAVPKAVPLCTPCQPESRPIALPACELLGPTVPYRVLTALAARLPPHSPPNPTVALLAEYRPGPARRSPGRAGPPNTSLPVARISSVDA